MRIFLTGPTGYIGGAVLDVRLPPTQSDEGLRAAIAVRKERPGFPVMVLSQYVEHLYARELLASGEGAVGYLLKNRVSDVAEFIEGLQRVIAGGTVRNGESVCHPSPKTIFEGSFASLMSGCT